MNYLTVLRHQPWLKFCDKFSISSRLLTLTNGDTFVAVNLMTGRYELHSVESYKLSESSQTAVLEPEHTNGFIYFDYQASELRRWVDDIKSERELIQHRKERRDNTDLSVSLRTKQLERMLGAKL